jgi:ribosomal protein S27AE
VNPEDEPAAREPRLARRSPFNRASKLCPRCLNPLKGGNELGGWLIPQDYYCPKCGYSGTVFLEKEPDEGTEEE